LVKRIISALKRYTYTGAKTLDRLRWKVIEKAVRPDPGTILDVPDWARPEWAGYHGHHGPWLENYFYIHWCLRKNEARSITWKYIPVFWTDYYAANKHETEKARSRIREWLLPKIENDEKYFTIVQHAEGIGFELPENVVVFAAGGVGDIPVPLPKPAWFNRNRTRDIRISFMGRLTGAVNITGVRGKMYGLLKNDKDCHFGIGTFFEFKDIIERSIFSLCPRGYGRTSFRLMESLAAGSIPIYIWDDVEWLPYKELLEWEKMVISINASELEKLPDLLKDYDDVRVKEMRQEIEKVYPEYFSMNGIAERITDMLKQCTDPDDIKNRFGINP
jgi:hypothetical protein